MLERARHRADRLGGNARIKRGGVQLGVAEQNLDDANIDILFEQVGGEGMAPMSLKT